MVAIEQVQRKVYTPNEVMTIFHISRPTFQDWCNKGIFRKITIPGQRKVFIHAESVDVLINGGDSARNVPKVHLQ